MKAKLYQLTVTRSYDEYFEITLNPTNKRGNSIRFIIWSTGLRALIYEKIKEALDSTKNFTRNEKGHYIINKDVLLCSGTIIKRRTIYKKAFIFKHEYNEKDGGDGSIHKLI